MAATSSTYKIVNANCLEYMRQLGDDSIDMVVTSPPYYNAREYSQWETYDKYILFMKEAFSECVRIVKNQKYIIVNVADILSGEKRQNRKPIVCDFTRMLLDLDCEYEDDIIWDKGEVQSKRGVCAEPFPYYYKPINCHEHILVFRKNFIDKTKIACPICNEVITQSNGLTSDGVQSWECKNPHCIRSSHNRGKRFSARTILMDSARLEFISDEVLNTFRRDIVKLTPEIKINNKKENKIGHSAPYPIMIPRFAVECYSRKGDTVLDIFAGSGTTGIACKELERNFIGVEINKEYCEIAYSRINSSCNEINLF